MAGLRVHNGGLFILFFWFFNMSWDEFVMESGPTIPWIPWINCRDCGPGQGHHGAGFRWRNESPWTAKPLLSGSVTLSFFSNVYLLSAVYLCITCIYYIEHIYIYTVHIYTYIYIDTDTVCSCLHCFCTLVPLQVSSCRNLLTTCSTRRAGSDRASFCPPPTPEFIMFSNDVGGSCVETWSEDGMRCEDLRLGLTESLAKPLSNGSSCLIWGWRYGRNRHWGKSPVSVLIYICFVFANK